MQNRSHITSSIGHSFQRLEAADDCICGGIDKQTDINIQEDSLLPLKEGNPGKYNHLN